MLCVSDLPWYILFIQIQSSVNQCLMGFLYIFEDFLSSDIDCGHTSHCTIHYTELGQCMEVYNYI